MCPAAFWLRGVQYACLYMCPAARLVARPPRRREYYLTVSVHSESAMEKERAARAMNHLAGAVRILMRERKRNTELGRVVPNSQHAYSYPYAYPNTYTYT